MECALYEIDQTEMKHRLRKIQEVALRGYGGGFRAILNDCFPDDHKKAEEKPKPVIRGFGRGFIGMLDEAFRS